MTNGSSINCGAFPVRAVFQKSKAFKVPIYQRDFAWKLEQVDLLWGDLLQAMRTNQNEYFLGAIVVSLAQDGNRVHDIVDGQQRLAVLTMLFSVLMKAWRKLGMAEQAVEISNAYLGEVDRRTRVLTPRLTLNANNSSVFQEIIQRSDHLAAPKSEWSKLNQLLWQAHDRLRIKLEEALSTAVDAEGALAEIEEFVAEKATLIVIEVGDEADAFTLFETLNDRGLELAVSDLVKNYLFAKSKGGLDKVKQTWSEIAGSVGSTNISTFLRQVWISEHEFVRDRELYRELKDKVNSARQVSEFVAKLGAQASHYSALASADHPNWKSYDSLLGVRRSLDALTLFRATQYKPLALSVMEGGTSKEIAGMLDLIVSLTFRYTVISDLSAAQLERIYATAAKEVRSKGKRDKHFLRELLKEAWVDDKVFLESFRGFDFDRAPIAKYVLRELNRHTEADKSMEVSANSTLEHILPQKPGKDWAGAYPAGRLEDFVLKVGNLTLLEKTMNNKLGNSDFKHKKSKAFSVSKLAINSDLKKKVVWTHKEIDARSRSFAKLALEIWK